MKQREEDKIYIEDYLVGRSIQDTRKFLRGLYEGAYNVGAYRAFSSTFTWPWYLKKHKPTFERGLEIGCGAGAGIKLGRDKGYNLWGIDCAHIPKIWKEFKVEKHCFTTEARELPFKDNSFDLVLIPDVLEHIPEEDVSGVLREMRRVGSKLYYALIDLGYEQHPMLDKLYTHITRRGDKWWSANLSEAGFHIKEIEHFSWDGATLKAGYIMGKHQPKEPWRIEINTYPGKLRDTRKQKEEAQESWEGI